MQVAFGGFGLRRTVRHGSAAYMTSLSASQPLVQIMRGGAFPEQEQEGLVVPELEGPQADALVGVQPQQTNLSFALALGSLNSQLRVPL